MTVWILHEALTPDEEARITERPYLALPFCGVPDLSAIHSREQCRRLMQSLDPDAPPETLAGKSERLWQRYSELRKEDIVIVPLPWHKELALAEVTERYRYQPLATDHDRHRMLVKWHSRRITFFSLRKHRAALEFDQERMVEIVDAELRSLVRERLSYKYNRFAGWRWLSAAILLLNMAMMLIKLANRAP